MRLAVEFKRYGAARFVSHLDMQRTVMRAVRRTKLEPEYSSGFNPHMLMSFASAMPVGLESDAEYFELKLIKDMPLEFCLSELQKAMPDGIAPVWAGRLSDKAPKLMAALHFAAYEAVVEEQYLEPVKIEIAKKLQSDKIEVETERNGAVKKKDIRPLIRSIDVGGGPLISMVLALSSEGSLNPELFLKAVADSIGVDFDYTLKRTGLYTVIDGRLKPLRDLCD